MENVNRGPRQISGADFRHRLLHLSPGEPTSIFASILKRTGSQILDVTDADVWVMDAKTEYFEQPRR